MIEICLVVERVLFTDKENIRLMNDAFQHGALIANKLDVRGIFNQSELIIIQPQTNSLILFHHVTKTIHVRNQYYSLRN